MIFIGDVHGEFDEYARMLRDFGDQPSIQLGDMGIGFGLDEYCPTDPPHRFIRGNHDNPAKCRKMPSYLGEFGHLIDEDIFYVSGAWSIDKAYRVPGYDWWDEEELSRPQMEKALALYEKAKPKVVCTHDCPERLLGVMYGRILHNRTAKFFDEMLDIHKPQVWVFAHHHRSYHYSLWGVEFFGLKILEAMKIEEQTVSVDYLGEDRDGEDASLYGGVAESG